MLAVFDTATPDAGVWMGGGRGGGEQGAHNNNAQSNSAHIHEECVDAGVTMHTFKVSIRRSHEQIVSKAGGDLHVGDTGPFFAGECSCHKCSLRSSERRIQAVTVSAGETG